ncbi:MAG: phosphatase PAP2 family protein [Gemmatimonadales bacterium]
MLRPVIKLRRQLAALLLLAFVPFVAALAQQPVQVERPVRYHLTPLADGGITVAGAALAALPSVLGGLPVASCPPLGACDPANLWGIDRGTVGVGRSDGPSNVALYATVAGSALLVAATRRGEPEATRAVLEDAVVMAQTAAIDGALTQWLKVAVHRARPERYTAQGATFTSIEDSRSFPSGHASFAFAAASAAASILHRRGELHRHRIETALLFAAAATTSVLRVSAHRHFPTDVVAGAALGSAVGWFIPQLHPID